MTPTTELELAEIIRTAKGPLAITGGGTRGKAREGEALNTSGLSGVHLYEPGALTLVVGAGTPVAEVEALLASKGQRLAFEPMDHRALLGTKGAPTIGGMVSVNHAGPRRVQAGSARDVVLGARFVDGTGRIVKNGGRVMKNVTGLDLARLMCGARGTLGVLTEVSFKVLPIPETTLTLVRDCSDPVQAVADMSRALGSPFEVSGAAWDGARVMLRIEGFAGSVAYRADRLTGLLDGFAEGTADWTAIRDVTAFAGTGEDVWRMSFRPSEGAQVAAALTSSGARVQLDWGGGLVWAACAAGTDLSAMVKGRQGYATRLRGSGPLAPTPTDPVIDHLISGLRSKFDPRGLFRT